MVLKCHGKIPCDDTSLQKKYGGANIGFGEAHELAAHGLVPRNETKPIGDALVDIQNETRAGKYPMVSLPVGLKKPTATTPGEVYFHVFVAEDSDGVLRLVDPSNGKIVEGTLPQIEARIKKVMVLAASVGCALPEAVNFLAYSDTPEEAGRDLL